MTEPTTRKWHGFEVTLDDTQAEHARVYRMSGVLGETQHCYAFLEHFRGEVKGEELASRNRLVFDLSALEFLSSTGIGIIAACITNARQAGKQVVLCCVPKQAARVLDVTGVSALAERFDSEADALAADADQ